MKIVIFGATGGTGRAAVEQALAAGHTVTAFARTPSKLGLAHPALRTVQGDILDAEAVRVAVEGKDAVLCCVGAPPASQDRIRERGSAVLVAAMDAAGVSRLVSLSSHGIAESAVELPWYMRWLVVPLYLRRVFADHEAQEAVVRGSGLDWTLVRPPHLTDGQPAAKLYHGTGFDPQKARMSIARADVAAFMLAQLGVSTYQQQTVVVSAAA